MVVIKKLKNRTQIISNLGFHLSDGVSIIPIIKDNILFTNTRSFNLLYKNGKPKYNDISLLRGYQISGNNVLTVNIKKDFIDKERSKKFFYLLVTFNF